MRERLSVRELFVMGGALFSMHFGAACMLFPVQWGKEAGTALWLVFIGIVLSDILLPYFGYLALVRGEGTFLSITRKASPKFGTFFIGVTILVMGPIYLVPRMSAAAWAGIVQLLGIQTESMVPVIIFSILYYLVTYWFVSNEGKVVEKVGHFLFPVLLIVVVAVIVKSIVTPIASSWTAPAFQDNPIAHGFLEGYATGDLQCALMFGIIVIHGIREAGIKESETNRALVQVGFIGLGILLLAHLGHMIAGANTGGTIPLTLSALYTEMVLQLWGTAGGALFNLALAAAALTTAIGAVSSTSDIWVELLAEKKQGWFSYKKMCAASCVISCLISFANLDTIVAVIGPVLDACYPSAIVLAVYYCFSRKRFDVNHLAAMKWAMIAAFIMSLIALLNIYNGMFHLGLSALERLYMAIPLSNYNLSWVWISALVYLGVLASRNFIGQPETDSE